MENLKIGVNHSIVYKTSVTYETKGKTKRSKLHMKRTANFTLNGDCGYTLSLIYVPVTSQQQQAIYYGNRSLGLRKSTREDERYS